MKSITKLTGPYCLVSFPTEGTHGVWPEYLIRRSGRCGFKAKFGKEWFKCIIEEEGIFMLFLVNFTPFKNIP